MNHRRGCSWFVIHGLAGSRRGAPRGLSYPRKRDPHPAFGDRVPTSWRPARASPLAGGDWRSSFGSSRAAEPAHRSDHNETRWSGAPSATHASPGRSGVGFSHSDYRQWSTLGCDGRTVSCGWWGRPSGWYSLGGRGTDAIATRFSGLIRGRRHPSPRCGIAIQSLCKFRSPRLTERATFRGGCPLATRCGGPGSPHGHRVARRSGPGE